MNAEHPRCWMARLALVMVVAWTPFVWALTASQEDDFEDGTVAGWGEGGPSPNPPTNVADGGPMGAGDNYLQNISSGMPGPGGRLAMFNMAQWACDYNAAGSQVTLAAEMVNLGSTALEIRLGVESDTGNLTQFVSTNAVSLPADGVWRTVMFTISDAEMTRVEGDQSLASLLDDVGELRILSAAAATWQGDQVAATLGVDNIRVDALPVSLQTFSVE